MPLGSGLTGSGNVQTAGQPRGGGGGVPAPICWDEAILRAFRKVNDQLFAQMYPTFDFTEGSLVLSRTDNSLISGAGSALTYSGSLTGGILMIKGTTAAGFVAVLSPANMLFGVSLAPQAIAMRIQMSDLATYDANTSLQVDFTDQNTYSAGIGFAGPNSLTKFTLFGTDVNGSNYVTTDLDLPATASEYTDVGALWDGQRLIGFAGQVHLGTFVPDLVNVLTDLTHMGNPPFGGTRARVLLAHNANAQRIAVVDKLNIWQGMPF